MRAADSANDYVPPSHLDVVSVQRIGSEERLEKFVTLEAGGCTCAALLGVVPTVPPANRRSWLVRRRRV
jgi:hypothetical protein